MASITTTQQINGKIAPKDRLGKPSVVDGVPEWVTDNSDVLTLTPAADGLSCLVLPTGMVGTANVQVTVDTRVGPDINTIIGTGEVTVTAGEATTVDIEFDPAVEQP